MARENQGLQIGLIVSAMLTIISLAAMFVAFSQKGDLDKKLKDTEKKFQAETSRAMAGENDVKSLKQMIFGTPNNDAVSAISGVFGEDMKKFAGGYPEDVRYYRPLTEKMSSEIADLNLKLSQATDKVKGLEAEFNEREANKKPQMDSFEKARDDAKQELEAETAKLTEDRNRITAEEAKIRKDLETTRKESAAELDAMNKKFQDAVAQYDALHGVNMKLKSKVEKLTSQSFEVPLGEILWINQRTGLVWIDLGRADGLHQQVTFSVYPRDVIDPTTSDKTPKANIEVTKILGEHLAEARLLDDRPIDPITVGDKIYTPLWMPGEKRHFALAGVMDFTGGDQNSIATMIDLIKMNGGEVDYYVDSKGETHGKMTVNTRYLILGKIPGENSLPASLIAFDQAIKEADRFGVQKIQFSDVLRKMGWKDRAPVVRFGDGSSDFSVKPETDRQSKPKPKIKDEFQPRHPPATAPAETR